MKNIRFRMKNIFNKGINYLIIVIMIVLILFSLIAIIAIHLKLFSLSLSFTSEGINYYLSTYTKYTTLFTGTISICGLYYGVIRLKLSIEANNDKIKQDYFNEWKITFDIRAAEFTQKDPFLIRELTKIRYRIYQDLYDCKFSIENKEALLLIFEEYFTSSIIQSFEDNNVKYSDMGGVYHDNKYTFSFDAFQFIFFGMIDKSYDEIYNDLKKIYLEKMKNDRDISADRFQAAALLGRNV